MTFVLIPIIWPGEETFHTEIYAFVPITDNKTDDILGEGEDKSDFVELYHLQSGFTLTWRGGLLHQRLENSLHPDPHTPTCTTPQLAQTPSPTQIATLNRVTTPVSPPTSFQRQHQCCPRPYYQLQLPLHLHPSLKDSTPNKTPKGSISVVSTERLCFSVRGYPQSGHSSRIDNCGLLSGMEKELKFLKMLLDFLNVKCYKPMKINVDNNGAV
jgi:hypothetical protein